MKTCRKKKCQHISTPKVSCYYINKGISSGYACGGLMHWGDVLVEIVYASHRSIGSRGISITSLHRGGTSFKTQAKILHRCAFGVPMNLVPAYVIDDNTGLPVSHGVVERCYSRFLACVQLYVREKQEDRRFDT